MLRQEDNNIVSADWTPVADNAQDLGLLLLRWRDLLLSRYVVFKGTTYKTSLLATEPAANRIITLPDPGADDIVALLSAAQELKNKTINAAVLKGSFTASGVVALPAFTLGGAISGNGQLISGLNGESLADLIVRGRFIFLPTATGWTETNVGTGACTFRINYITQVVGATANSSTIAKITNIPMESGSDTLTNPVRPNFNKKIYISFLVWRESAFAGIVSRVQFKVATAIGQLGEAGFGIQITNMAMVGESYGTGRAETPALVAAMVSRRSYRVTIVHDPGVSIKWYIDGVLAATQSTAANIPSGEGASSSTFMVSMQAGDPSSAGCEFACTAPIIWQAV